MGALSGGRGVSGEIPTDDAHTCGAHAGRFSLRLLRLTARLRLGLAGHHVVHLDFTAEGESACEKVLGATGEPEHHISAARLNIIVTLFIGRGVHRHAEAGTDVNRGVPRLVGVEVVEDTDAEVDVRGGALVVAVLVGGVEEAQGRLDAQLLVDEDGNVKLVHPEEAEVGAQSKPQKILGGRALSVRCSGEDEGEGDEKRLELKAHSYAPIVVAGVLPLRCSRPPARWAQKKHALTRPRSP